MDCTIYDGLLVSMMNSSVKVNISADAQLENHMRLDAYLARPGTIGVYVTYHNERELLTELICSLISEMDQPEEIMVYDDCSSFPAEDFIPPGARVKVVRGTENRGPAFGRNRLLEHSSTDYVHFHDSDDFFLPGWLRRVRQIIDDCAPEAVFTEVAPYRNGELKSASSGLKRLDTTTDLLGFCIENAMLPACGTYSRKLLLSMGGYPDSLWQSEDYAFHIRLATRCTRYCIVTEPLVGKRSRDDSRSCNQIEVYRDGLAGLRLVAPEIPASHQSQVADAAIAMSRKLYQLGDVEGACDGFSWAVGLGSATYRNQQWGYSLCARLFGPMGAELIGAAYRKLPTRLRKTIQ